MNVKRIRKLIQSKKQVIKKMHEISKNLKTIKLNEEIKESKIFLNSHEIETFILHLLLIINIQIDEEIIKELKEVK